MSDHDYYTAYAEEDDGDWREELERAPEWDEERIALEAAALERLRALSDELRQESIEFERDWREREERIKQLGASIWR